MTTRKMRDYLPVGTLAILAAFLGLATWLIVCDVAPFGLVPGVVMLFMLLVGAVALELLFIPFSSKQERWRHIRTVVIVAVAVGCGLPILFRFNNRNLFYTLGHNNYQPIADAIVGNKGLLNGKRRAVNHIAGIPPGATGVGGRDKSGG